MSEFARCCNSGTVSAGVGGGAFRRTHQIWVGSVPHVVGGPMSANFDTEFESMLAHVWPRLAWTRLRFGPGRAIRARARATFARFRQTMVGFGKTSAKSHLSVRCARRGG